MVARGMRFFLPALLPLWYLEIMETQPVPFDDHQDRIKTGAFPILSEEHFWAEAIRRVSRGRLTWDGKSWVETKSSK